MAVLLRRDTYSEHMDYSPPTVVFLILLLLTCCCVGSLLFLRRRRRMALRAASLPIHHRHGHQRTLTITTVPQSARGEAIIVYDEKMNLIADSHGRSQAPVPEIHVTFPDEEDTSGRTQAGRVVVLKLSDSGSIGMEPLHQEPLPPYQRSENERFASLDLDRIGGLKEKDSTPRDRYS